VKILLSLLFQGAIFLWTYSVGLFIYYPGMQ